MGKIVKRRCSGRFQCHSFERKCRCDLHDDQKNDSCRLYRIDGKEIRKCDVNWLRNNGHLSDRANYVCSDCILVARNFCKKSSRSRENENQYTVNHINDNQCSKENYPFNEDSEVHDLFIAFNEISLSQSEDIEDQDTIVNKVVQLLDKQQLSQSNLEKLSLSIGKHISKNIYQDLKSQQNVYKSLADLPKLDCHNFIANIPIPFINLLTGMTNIDIKICDKKRMNSLCILVEQIFYLRNMNYIGPISFSQSLVKWALAGSKTIQTIDGSSTPSGSVTTLKNVLCSASLSPNTCNIDGDLEVFFDNTQRVGKTCRVRENGTTPVNVATNVVFIKSNSSDNLQYNDKLKPECWVNRDNSDVIKQKIEQLDNKCIEIYDTYKWQAESSILRQVSQELHYDNIDKLYKDHVLYSIATSQHSPENQVCCNCCYVFSRHSSVCPNCNRNTNKDTNGPLLYHEIPAKVPKALPLIKQGEIIGVNPNSRETVTHVLQNIVQQTCIGDRKWIRVGCDGVPYNIADSVIDSLVKCDSCQAQIDLRESSFGNHVNEKHKGNKNISNTRVFGNVLMQAGAGHIEINLLRALFSLCRFIFMESLADQLGFKSKAAKQFIVGCGNHHLSWQIVQIVYFSIAAEIYRSYIIHCYSTATTPTSAGFKIWLNSVKNKNIVFYYSLVFTYFLGIKCYRSGIRQNNSEYSMAGRRAVAPLMFSGKHTIYQNLLYKDLKIRASAPDQISNYIANNESFSRSGEEGKCEGGDYVTEHENRCLKCQLPPGVPTVQSWRQASRCCYVLKSNRDAVFKRIGIKDPGAEMSSPIEYHQNEIQMFRRYIRSSGIFENPFEEKELQSVDNVLLNPKLFDAVQICNDNYKSYLDHGKEVFQPQPLFVTNEDEAEYNDVKNWTINKIKKETERMIDLFPDQVIGSVFKQTHIKEVSKAKKDVQVQFYQEVATTLDLLMSTEVFEANPAN